MLHKVLIEQYLMAGDKLFEPFEVETICDPNNTVIFQGKYDNVDAEGKVVSVLNTPWGRFSMEVFVPAYEDGDVHIITHSLSREEKPDPADWWKK